MSKKFKMPLGFKILIGLISFLLGLVMIFLVFVGIVYKKYEINVFDVYKQVKIVNQPTNLKDIVNNPYTANDTEMIQTKINIVNGNFDVTDEFLNEVDKNVETKFSDAEIGAMMDYIITGQDSLDVFIGSKVNLKDYGFKVLQIDFRNIKDDTIDFNVVFKVELQKVKSTMKNFPLNFIVKFVPNELVFSSTLTITKGKEPFNYSTSSKTLTINNLNALETKNIMKVINLFTNIGDCDEFNLIIGNMFVDFLIGNAENNGFAYSFYSSTPKYISNFKFESGVVGGKNFDYFVMLGI